MNYLTGVMWSTESQEIESPLNQDSPISKQSALILSIESDYYWSKNPTQDEGTPPRFDLSESLIVK